MSIVSSLSSEEKSIFRPFTRESLRAIEQRIAAEHERQKEIERKRAEGQIRYEEEDEDEGPQPDATLEQGVPLPVRLHSQFPSELISIPLEDIDPYYHNQRTFVVISRGKDIFRFSATDAVWALDPFNPIRRVAINILTHPLFSVIIIMTILTNCVLMALPSSPTIESTEVIFTGIYTFESAVKVMARGFILENFTYLRDAWNWLDFVVITLAYMTMGIELGNLAVLRTFRVLRALKTVAIVPGLKTIVGAVIESVKNLRDVIILTMFSLSVFALMGLQLYMGVLTQKCIRRFPEDGSYGNLTHESWDRFCSNSSNWLGDPQNYNLCGNSSGAGQCPPDYVCLQGFGGNPNYGYTSFDTFGWALLSAFRLMTQDFWENLYQQVLRVQGPYHIMFFIVIIFLGSFYLVNLILAIVAMSYDELQKKAEEEEAAEEEAIRQAEEAAEAREQKKAAHEGRVAERAEAAAAAAAVAARGSIPATKSPSEFSCQSYEMYIRQEKPGVDDNRERYSLHSTDTVSQGKSMYSTKKRKVSSAASLSLPGSPFNIRRASRGSHQFTLRSSRPRFPPAADTRPLVLNTLLDAHDHLPYVDDSTAVTPMSDENGAIIIMPQMWPHMGTRQNSYTSHTSRISYTSHADLLKQPVVYPTKESQLRSRSANYYNNACSSADYNRYTDDGGGYVIQAKFKRSDGSIQQQPLVDMKDVMVLNEIIEQAAGKQSRDGDLQVSTVYYFPTAADGGEGASGTREIDEEEEEDELTTKEKFLMLCMKGIDCCCIWDCCSVWLKFQSYVGLLVFDPFVELFITLCIVVNTLFMALDHYNISEDFYNTLKSGNYFFSATFGIEAVLKLTAMSPKFYFQVGWNIFDFIIVVLSLVEFSLEGVQGLSVLRSFRLLRVFKLAKSWPTLNLLISIMGRTIGALGNLTFVLCIIIFIFAVMGMQLFGKNYVDNVHFFPEAELPRWNFTDFMHSFMIVFRVLCGEWIESMWDCLLVADGDVSCIPFFLATVVIGNLVVLNLFLALLLSNFGSSNLSAPTADSDTSKIVEAFDRIGRFNRWIKNGIFNLLKYLRRKITNQISAQLATVRNKGSEFDVAKANEILADGLLAYGDNSGNRKSRLDTTIGEGMEFTIRGDIKSRYYSNSNGDKRNQSIMCNNIGNHRDNNRIDLDYIKQKFDHDTISNKSYGSHKHHSYKNSNSHKGSFENMMMLQNREEKADTSKDDIGHEFDAEGREDSGIIAGMDDDKDIVKINDELVPDSGDEMDYPADCFPDDFYRRFPFLVGDDDSPFWQGWANLRLKTFQLIENKYFETAVITMILLSSLALALEDVHLQSRPILQDILYYMDRIFTVVFFLEMLTKWLALGFRKYFTNAWCWLDFIIVMLSLINLAAVWLGAADIPAFRSMRTLRALRPLRAVSRWEGMRVSLINFVANLLGAGGIQAFKTMRTLRALRPLRAMARMQGMRVVVNALVQAIPSIFNVLLVCLIFWLIFAIMGVQLFAGKYHKCVDENNTILDHEIVPDETTCLRENYTWQNSPMNFDHVGKAYLCLFQVATFKGWMPIMYDAIDSREVHKQPIKESNLYMYLYFVFFIIFGSFFTLNLFIGVIIDNFNEQKKKIRGSLEMFMTEDQKKYYNAMKKMGSKKPLKAIPRPKWKPQLIAFDIVTDKKFDMVIMLFIGLNMLTMTLDRYKPSKLLGDSLELLNTIFIVIFSSECFLKVFALRYHYFKEPWNLFDFIVVILSVVGLVLSDIIAKYFVSPTLLRVVRVAKVGRVLRLVKGAKGIRTLLFALAMSLPALFNICLLLFLVMFIFAIFGMSFFMHVKPKSGIDDVYNFKTFGQSFILLFQMSTSAGWDGVLDGIINEEECELPNIEMGSPGSCGNATIGITFLLSYLVISFLIVINMYIAVILENYSQATEDVQEGLTDDDYDMYYEIWQQFDPDGTQYIRYDQLSNFLDILEPPLQIHKPNKYKIVSMDIPICKDDMMFCVDILDALTKDFFARKGSPIDETVEVGEIQTRPEEADYNPVSSTLWRQREQYCAQLIQNTWRRYVRRKQTISNNEDRDPNNEDGDPSGLPSGTDTEVLVEDDGGHKVIIHSRSPSIGSGGSGGQADV